MAIDNHPQFNNLDELVSKENNNPNLSEDSLLKILGDKKVLSDTIKLQKTNFLENLFEKLASSKDFRDKVLKMMQNRQEQDPK